MSTPSFDFPRILDLVTRLQQPPPAPVTGSSGAAGATRQARLDELLKTSCRRGGLRSLALCDASGLPLAMVDSPIDEERLAGLTAVLGEALERAAKLWEGPLPETLSLDIDYSDKLVFRTFVVDQRGYSLLGICGQEIDERGELELAVGAAAGLIQESAHRR